MIGDQCMIDTDTVGNVTSARALEPFFREFIESRIEDCAPSYNRARLLLALAVARTCRGQASNSCSSAARTPGRGCLNFHAGSSLLLGRQRAPWPSGFQYSATHNRSLSRSGARCAPGVLFPNLSG